MPLTASSAMSGLFSGLGKTKVIMWINVAATAVNLTLDYMLIFGKAGFPALGIKGAAIATVISMFFSFIVYTIIALKPAYNKSYNILKGWRFNRNVFSSLIKFGLPSGLQFFIEISGVTFFILFIGRLGRDKLAATNIAFNISTLSFMPLIGLGIAVSVLVGQYLGREKPDLAEYSAYSGFHISIIYVLSIVFLYIFLPDLFIAPFAAGADQAEFKAIRGLAIVLLRFIAVYSVFDAMNIIFASSIKGAGDTRFVMYMIFFISIFVLIIPSYLIFYIYNLGIYAGWALITLYAIILGISFLLRFLSGKWKKMRVIDSTHIPIPTTIPESPK